MNIRARHIKPVKGERELGEAIVPIMRKRYEEGYTNSL